MELSFSELSYDAKWYEYKDAELEIRPYPSSLTNAMISRDQESFMLSGAEQCKMFIYCLTGWRKVVDANGNAFKLTDEVKKKIFDFRIQNREFAELVNFVLSQNASIAIQKEEQEKNS